ncbi:MULTISPECIES: hypothetical protein [unclassified Saccharibacter]|uniref:hypothetical protein n=1 Tax=unclassified Saccharibacter TaxID=2648722 RepID=UPI001329DF59|nr:MULTISPECIES: hypothetical protein [unclassified Saccharibacter]MXV36948.1 hypothetical protein [Saccharibacter sp. EH611]MXV58562.1 hypothetical protein [Saccharibacter sp. EH70]MXV66068.1 hypothetical protein [Saccharibacter sp. EH60]
MTGLKDFAPLGASLFSILIAGAALWVARSQKKINANAYKLNLFKERFAAYKKFQEIYENKPHKNDMLQKIREEDYPNKNYISTLKEVYFLFGKREEVKELLDIVDINVHENIDVYGSKYSFISSIKNRMNDIKKRIKENEFSTEEFIQFVYSVELALEMGIKGFPGGNWKELLFNYISKYKSFSPKNGFDVDKEIMNEDVFSSLCHTYLSVVSENINRLSHLYNKEDSDKIFSCINVMMNESYYLDRINSIIEENLLIPYDPMASEKIKR